MKNRNPKIVKIEDEFNIRFSCKKCHQVWYPNITPDSGGKLYYGSWRCPNGCKSDPKK